jgi:hypothetical protein
VKVTVILDVTPLSLVVVYISEECTDCEYRRSGGGRRIFLQNLAGKKNKNFVAE